MGESGTFGTTGGSNAGTSAGDFAGESAVSGGAAGLGGALGDAGAPASGGMPAASDAGQGGGGGASGTNGASSGAGGTAAGSGGANPPATGCAKLSIPLDAATDKAHLVITLATATDLSAATLSSRIYVLAGAGGTIFNYVQDSGTYHFLGVPAAQRTMLSSVAGWSTLLWNVGAEPDPGTGIVKTSIKNIGIEVNAQPSSVWSNPTVIYIDSITISTPTVTSTFTFDSSSTVNPTPMTSNVSGQALWINAGATDTTAAGTSVSWQATCP